ncbi:phosphoenolpyruvate synthase [Oscillatoria salina]|uniref:phosphoenolpyruvate synthase n=1 Tax=Oscillatoria salina TaxID=331517 RepID=UPI001CCDF751|nr:phosphoenolpyruvate synthase [Oscillatoria salina]MBZ8182277.1 phosphoenolpyruvate synthase [Oscillatoria salina IIICB1]
MSEFPKNKYIRWFENLDSNDVDLVGGKNASLGEMIQELKKKGIRVPDGFATTAEAYRYFLAANELTEKIKNQLDKLAKGEENLEKVGAEIRQVFAGAEFPEDLAKAIEKAYRELSDRYEIETVDVAARSSATAEDLPSASFAGQQETFLNLTGEAEVLDACRKCYASLFTDRAISYRENQGFDHLKVALSVGVQKMVRSDKASAGVMFSLDTETGFPNVVVIDGAWGLGENVVQGSVTPDEYKVFKPLLSAEKIQPIVGKKLGTKEKKMVYASGDSHATENQKTSAEERQQFTLTDEEILQLAKWATAIEAHYEKPMDMEWAKDGETSEMYIVQARPETVQSQKNAASLKTYQLKEQGEKILTGISIGEAIAAGKVCRIKSAEDIEKFTKGSILVTEMTDPDWVPIMKQAAAIVTDYGGRTCHAAIVSRELGIPAIVGTEKATHILEEGQEITVSCAEGDEAFIYQGILEYDESDVSLQDIPETKTQIMMNIASPSAAFRWWRLPSQGIGLARMEFIINNTIKIHPMALVHFNELADREAQQQIAQLTAAYPDRIEYFVENLALGIGKIAASQHPNPVIVRMSDFKTNEYADLIGGKQFEPQESNPMLGFRGASRYYSDRYREGFALECRAIKRVREVMGFTNVIIMIPFCRTLAEADKILTVLAENNLKKGENDLQIYVMCEIPANVELAAEFSQRFDGFSIGSNDLTQLVLGVDRDSEGLSDLFDEQNLAVKRVIRRLIDTAKKNNRKVGICGQAPSDYPDFAAFLVEAGIDSISLNPDSVIQVKRRIAEIEKEWH